MRVRVPARHALIVAACSLLSLPPVFAQDVGAIRGTIQDASGAVLPGVTVTLLNPGTIGGNQQTTSDARGAFQFPSLIPSSTYKVTAELQGFRPSSIENIVVNAAVTARVDLALQLNQVAEEVTVTGQSPLLDTTTVANHTVPDR